MTRDEETALIRSALDHAARAYPPKPEVDRHELELYVDASGEEAALITVVLKDESPVRLYSWVEVAPLRQAILDACRAEGVTRWPYVQFVLQSELDSAPEDDEPQAANG